MIGLMFSVDAVRIGLEQDGKQIDDPSDAKQSQGKDIENSHADLAFIELVGAKHTKEET